MSEFSETHQGVVAIITDRYNSRFVVQQKDADYKARPLGYSWFGGAREPTDNSLDESLWRELREEIPDAVDLFLGPACQVSFLGTFQIETEHEGQPHTYPLAVFRIQVPDAVLDGAALWDVKEGLGAQVKRHEELKDLDWVWGLEQLLQTEPRLQPKERPVSDCIFCKIVDGLIKVDIVAENDFAICFADQNPQAAKHLLVVPKVHFNDLNGTNDYVVLGHMMLLARKVGMRFGNGYRVINNTGDDAGNTMKHLHLHVLGGEDLGGLRG